MTTTPPAPERDDVLAGTDVFLSYSRHDRDSVARLSEALQRRGRSVWVDWAGIPPTAEWMAEIYRGIDAADAVVFVLSPAAVSSPVCSDELAYAVSRRKRIVPVVVSDVASESVPPELARLQWLSAGDDVDQLADELVAVLGTDLDAVRTHTRLTVRAGEWEASGRDSGLLLRGADLAAAESWLASPGHGPEPTSAQVSYVSASRRSAVRRQRGLLVAVSAALVAALLLGLVAVTQRRTADEQAESARQQALVADAQRLGAQGQSVDDPSLGVLLAAAGERLVDSPTTRSSLLASLVRWDGLRGTYGWGSPITSIAAGSDGSLWVSDGTHADQLHLDLANPAASIRGLHLRYNASLLATDASGRWLASGVPLMGRGASGSYDTPTVRQQVMLTDTAKLGYVEIPYARQPYADVLDDGSPVAPVLTDDALVMVASPRSSSAPWPIRPTAVDPGEPPTGSRLRSYSVLAFPRVTMVGNGGFPPEPWGSRVVDLGRPVRALVGADGGRLLAATWDAGSGEVVVLEATTLRVVRRSPVPVRPASIAALPGGGVLIGGTDGGLVLMSAGGRVRTLRSAHTAAVRVLSVSPDGRSFASGSVDGSVTVRGVDGGLRYSFGAGAAVTGLVWAEGGRALIESDRGGGLRVYDVDPARRLSQVLVTGLPQPWTGGTQIRLSAGGRVLAVVGPSSDTAPGGRLALVDLRDGRVRSIPVVARTAGTVPSPVSVALDVAGSTAIVATQEGLSAYRAVGDRLVVRPAPRAARPPDDETADVGESVELAPDGQAAVYLAGGLDRQTLADQGHAQVVQAIDPMTLASTGRRLSPRGPADPQSPGDPTYYGTLVAGTDLEHPLLTCGLACFQRADLVAGTLVPASDPVDDATMELALNRVRVRVAAAGGDAVIEGTDGGLVRLFAGDRLRPVSAWSSAQIGRIHSVAVSADGGLAASGGSDGSALLWDVGSGTRVGPPVAVGGSGDYVSVALAPGSLLTVDTQGTLRRTPTDPADWVELACRKAGRDLTTAEWQEYLPGRQQVALCPAKPPVTTGSATAGG